MKRILAWALVRELLGALVSGYVRVLTRTLRWRREGLDAALPLVAGPQGFLVLFWHGRLSLAMASLPLLGTKPRRALISLSRDGEFIAAAARRLGAPAIRGSSEKSGARAPKGGAAAYRTAVDFLNDGGIVLLTPDGPRGPVEVMSKGPLQLARAASSPVFLLGLAARWTIRLGTWDRMRLPLPFSPAALVVEGPLSTRDLADGGQGEALRVRWQAKIDQAQRRAEALAGQ